MTHGTRAAALFATLSLAVWTAPPALGQGQLKKVPQPKPEGTQTQLQRSQAQPEQAEAVEIQRKSAAGLKLQPLQPGRSDAPMLQRDTGPESFEHRVESMEKIQALLDQTFDEFEREHQRALKVARRMLQKFDQCHEKIYTNGSYSQAERDAACSPGEAEDRCLSKLLRRCIGSDADKYEQSLLALHTQSDEIANLLAPYQRRSIAAELR